MWRNLYALAPFAAWYLVAPAEPYIYKYCSLANTQTSVFANLSSIVGGMCALSSRVHTAAARLFLFIGVLSRVFLDVMSDMYIIGLLYPIGFNYELERMHVRRLRA